MIQKHHIIPKHAGGKHEPWNIACLTQAEHADAHFIRWVLKGDDGDRIAWLAMTGQIPRAAATRLAQVANGKRHKGMKMPPVTQDRRQRLRESLLRHYRTGIDCRRGRKLGPKIEDAKKNMSLVKSRLTIELRFPDGQTRIIVGTNIYKLSKEFGFNEANIRARGHSVGFTYRVL